MAKGFDGWTLGALAAVLGEELIGPADLRIARLTDAKSGDSMGIAFAESEAFLEAAEAASVSAVIVNRTERLPRIPCIRVDNPRFAFLQLLAAVDRRLPLNSGINPTAQIDPSAKVHSSANIGPYAIVAGGAVIGENVSVHSHCYVGENCILGPFCILHPHVVLVRDVSLGPYTVIHPGAVIGADGFGFHWDGTRQIKVPQVGSVELGENCEVGALTSIDRATVGKTRLGNDVKLDNLVQVAHNVTVGDHTVIAAQTGVSGSCTIGERVTIAGQVAMADHATIADDVTLGGRTGVMKSVEKSGVYLGTPPRPPRETLRIMALQQRLPELMKRIDRLEAQVKELKHKLGESE